MERLESKQLDHLFRHQYGKMVAILTRVFGFAHIETIEDAVQDTFVKATTTWRRQIPDNPEAWLTKAAKNRVIDMFRQLKASKNRELVVQSGAQAMALNELFLDAEIEDSQLRMIFTACHPKLNISDQITFALKTISGFSTNEIAAALLLKKETVKKRLSRARKTIQSKKLSFHIPQGKALVGRMDSVLNVIYLLFNEGFHSNNKVFLLRKDLCGEALRLCQLLLKKEELRSGKLYALFSLLCFQSSRLESKLNKDDEIIDIEHQDRRLWYRPLIKLGQNALSKAFDDPELTKFHLEAAIAHTHIKAASFQETNWNDLLRLNKKLNAINPTPLVQLNMAMIYLQLSKNDDAHKVLHNLSDGAFHQRTYLYYGAWAAYYKHINNYKEALNFYDLAIAHVTNKAEKAYLLEKRKSVNSENKKS